MSQSEVERIIGRAMTDSEFRMRLLNNATEACQGYDLTQDELDAFAQLDANSLARFSDSINNRLSSSREAGADESQ